MRRAMDEVAARARGARGRAATPRRPAPAWRWATLSGRASWPAPRARRCGPRPSSFARAALAGEMARPKPWVELLISAVRARGEAAKRRARGPAAAELELYPRKERKRVETEWTERTRRVPAARRDRARSTSACSSSPVVCRPQPASPGAPRTWSAIATALAELREDAGRDPVAAARGDRAGGGGRGSDFSSTSRRSWPAKRSPTGSSSRWRREHRASRRLTCGHPVART